MRTSQEMGGHPAAGLLDQQSGKVLSDKPPLQLRARFGTAAVVSGYLALVVVYVCSFGRTAWHPTDYEYMMACVWRIAHGEVPYRDFIYHKTPGSLWIHVVWLTLPGSWGVLGSRAFFYLQIAASGLLPIVWAQRREFITFGWRLPVLGLATCALAMHNFPAMAWQTSDGIFFSTIGAVAALESISSQDARRALVARAIASASLAMGLLCKQSFFMPLLLFGLLVGRELLTSVRVRREHKSNLSQVPRLLLLSIAPGVAIFLGTYLYLRVTGALPAFFSQFKSQSTTSALVELGFWEVESPYRWVLVISAAVPMLRLFGSRGGRRFWVAHILAAALVTSLLILLLNHSEEPRTLGAILFFVLLGTLAGRILLRFAGRITGNRSVWTLTDGRMIWMHCFLVSIAWSSQLSLGYHTPLLGMAGLGLVLHEVLPEERRWALDFAPLLLLTALVLVSFWKLNQEQPYRDLSRPSLTEDLGRIFPKLSGIRTNPGTFARYAELNTIIANYAVKLGKPYVLVQDYPGVHWLMGDRNPIHIDWAYFNEIEGFDSMLWNDLVASQAVAIVPKEWYTGWTSEPPAVSCDRLDFRSHTTLSNRVVREWRLILSGRAFCVYVP